MLRIARSSVNRRLIRNTFCYGSEVVPVLCKRGLRVIRLLHEVWTKRIYHYIFFCHNKADTLPRVSRHFRFDITLLLLVKERNGLGFLIPPSISVIWLPNGKLRPSLLITEGCYVTYY